ncbi:hypothetical protein BN129_1346 [Cronobacter sakazakii 701]|nr:hypothetical protein BN129_1346 [Cronobacter sakazakii 701]
MAMDIAHNRQHVIDIAIYRRDKFQKGFGKVRRDPLMG